MPTDFLRYFPRRVSLAPNEAQTIRVQLTRTGNLEQGEYRSHMYFRAVEEQTALGAEEAEESEGISINIKTVFGISIPIIVREGESTTNIDLDRAFTKYRRRESKTIFSDQSLREYVGLRKFNRYSYFPRWYSKPKLGW